MLMHASFSQKSQSRLSLDLFKENQAAIAEPVDWRRSFVGQSLVIKRSSATQPPSGTSPCSNLIELRPMEEIRFPMETVPGHAISDSTGLQESREYGVVDVPLTRCHAHITATRVGRWIRVERGFTGGVRGEDEEPP